MRNQVFLLLSGPKPSVPFFLLLFGFLLLLLFLKLLPTPVVHLSKVLLWALHLVLIFPPKSFLPATSASPENLANIPGMLI